MLPQTVTTVWRTKLGTTLLIGFNNSTGLSAYFRYLGISQSPPKRRITPSSSPVWPRGTRALASENLNTSLDYRNVFRRKIQPALVKCGLGGINFQAMRRTFASQGKASGVDAKTRSDIMGNTVDVNENEYTQTPFDVKKKAMRKVEKRILQ
jgi:integrase